MLSEDNQLREHHPSTLIERNLYIHEVDSSVGEQQKDLISGASNLRNTESYTEAVEYAEHIVYRMP